jgi:hypothetical protein
MNEQYLNESHKESSEYQNHPQDEYQINTDATVIGQPAIYGQASNPAQYTGIDPQSVLNQDVQAPALDYNGYVLYALPRPVPGELIREPTGSSVAEPGAVLDEENGRTYVDHETGRYFLPNDPVRTGQVINQCKTLPFRH